MEWPTGTKSPAIDDARLHGNRACGLEFRSVLYNLRARRQNEPEHRTPNTEQQDQCRDKQITTGHAEQRQGVAQGAGRTSRRNSVS
jgi:hypothetical protein